MIRAIIVGVSKYIISAKDLPYCRNDIYAMKEAFTQGLNVEPRNIAICGEYNTVMMNDLFRTFSDIEKNINSSDTFIFYFSGHGAKVNDENYLLLSDNYIGIETVIGLIDNLNCKNKIVMLDCCHAGNKNTHIGMSIDINETVDQFVGRGCAVMASCDFDETSGFDSKAQLSLYTRILYEAFTARALIRKGKKSLEDIKIYVDRLANIANKRISKKQHNAFRSNIVGTIYFDVEDYEPYKSSKIYKETDKYIIYSANPIHSKVKRVSLEVILRFPCSEQELADIANEIKDEARSYEVYTTQMSEMRFRGLPNNIIFGYYGYDKSDIVNHNYAYRTIWVDKSQDKSYWYRSDKNACVIDDIWINTINSYNFNKKLISDNTADNAALVEQTRSCMYKMIIAAERFIGEYREYINRTITEQDLIANVKGIATEIRKLYFEQSDFKFASNELHEWQTAYSNLASVIDNFVLCYDEYSLKNRDSKNRMELFELTIKSYNESLETLKSIDTDLEKMLVNSGDSYE